MKSALPDSLNAFLAWEETQSERHEFADGGVSLFPGGTLRHAVVAANLIAALRPHLTGPARLASSDVRIVMPGRSRYADACATRDERDRPDATSVSHPFLIVEIVSESSAFCDRGDKSDEYRGIATLEEYVLVDSRKRWVQTLRRVDATWVVALPQRYGTLEFASVPCAVPFETLYAGTDR